MPVFDEYRPSERRNPTQKDQVICLFFDENWYYTNFTVIDPQIAGLFGARRRCQPRAVSLRYSPRLPPCLTPKIQRSLLAFDYESRINLHGLKSPKLALASRSASRSQILFGNASARGNSIASSLIAAIELPEQVRAQMEFGHERRVLSYAPDFAPGIGFNTVFTVI